MWNASTWRAAADFSGASGRELPAYSRLSRPMDSPIATRSSSSTASRVAPSRRCPARLSRAWARLCCVASALARGSAAIQARVRLASAAKLDADNPSEPGMPSLSSR